IDNIQTLRLGTAVSLPGGEEGYLCLSTALTPVSTTTQTLQVQLIYISLLLVALSAVLALFLSRRITSPIVSINQPARELAEGNYSVTFHESGYREAGELAETLNYAAGELSK
ncbi:HAMP domain-containing protein, partial [Bittarella massiliensis (ex Durand et al. 2017)]